ncbi:MAG TPA: NAD+ synthase [Thermoleophilaceae bacterium]|nr:NAD+ synthase [Thermoleophilaceae bacterium]
MTDTDPTRPRAQPLRVAGAQLENVVGDIQGNYRRILDAMSWAEAEGADVLVLPELALTGYPLDDLALRPEFVDSALSALSELARRSGRTTTVVGTIDAVRPRRGRDSRPRGVAIAAGLLCGGELRGMYHKVLLPNYEVFDEARNFAAGRRPGALWRIGGTVAGVSICEDLWSGDGPPEAQAAGGAQILLVPNASPFHRGKVEGRRSLAAAVARRNGVPVVYVNCVGGQDELVFDGGSIVVDGDGGVLFRAVQFEPARFCLDVPIARPRPLGSRPSVVHARVGAPRVPDPPPPSPPQAAELAQVWQALVLGTRDFTHRNGAGAAVLGLSGGMDSAVTAAVAADALGPENVLGVSMPSPGTPDVEVANARRLAADLGIAFQILDVAPVLAALTGGLATVLDDTLTERSEEELHARSRGAMLLAIADELGRILLATGNKSELSVGSAVLYGDMAGGFAPIRDCPKTLLYELARHRNARGRVVPEAVLERPPTALHQEWLDLPPYEVLDPIVERYVEAGASPEGIIAAGFDRATVRGVLQLIDDAEFERRQAPPGVKITARAFGKDRRMPIANAWRPFAAEEEELVASPDGTGAAIPAPPRV